MLSILQGKEQLAAKPSSKELIKSFLGGSLSILLLLALSHWTGHIYLMAPFGATCVLLYAVSRSPLAQPRNVIFGHFVSALVGLLALKLFSASAFSMAIAVGAAICLMQFLRCVHPPCWCQSLGDFADRRPSHV